MRRKLSITLTRLGLILFGLLLSLVILEIAFRILYPDPSPKLVNQGLQFHPVYRLAFTPNAEGWNSSLRGEYSTYIKINSKGLRGQEYPYQKDDDVFRILVLGDSFTAALQVPEQETFPKLLETHLQQQFPATKIEVINAGVVGYGTDNALAYYTHEGYRYHPDLVLLAFFTGNDLTDNIWYSLYDLDDGELTPVKSISPQQATPQQSGSHVNQLRSFLYNNSRLYSVSIELVTLSAVQKLPALADLLVSAGLVEITRPIVNYGNIYAFRYLPEEAWLKSEALILKLRQEVEANGSRLAVAILPDETDVDPDRRQEIQQAYGQLIADKIEPGPPPATQLAQRLHRHDILTIELLDALRTRHQQGERLFYRYDGHWTPAGHRAAAQTIFEGLMEHQAEIKNFPADDR